MTPATNRYARLALVALIVPLAVYVVVAVVRGRMRKTAATPAPAATASLPPGEASEMKEFTFQQTREGRPLYRLRARRLVGSEGGAALLEGIEALEIERADGTITVQADRARLLRPEESVSSLDLDGSVRAVTPTGERFEAPHAHYEDSTSTVTATAPVTFRAAGIEGEGRALEYNTVSGRVALEGPVSLQLLEGPLSGWTASADRMTRESKDAALVLSGGVRLVRPIAGGASPEWIESTRVEVGPGEPIRQAAFTGPVRGALATSGQPVSFSAERMTVERAEASGGPSVASLRGSATLSKRLADGSEQTLAAPEIDVHFTGEAQPERTEARGGAVLTETTPEGPSEVRAQTITLALAGEGLDSGLASGDVRLRRSGSGESGGFQGGGAEADLEKERIRLRGGAGSRAWVRTDRRYVQADTITSDAGNGPVTATGRVHVRIPPRPRNSSGGAAAASLLPVPLFSTGKTLYLEAPEATFLREPVEQARFRGGVRAWQDDASLQAASLDYAEDEGTAHAWGGTVTRGLRRPTGKAPVPVTVTAPEMFAEDRTGLVRYLGGAVYTEPEGTMRAREIRLARAAGAPEGGTNPPPATDGTAAQKTGTPEPGRGGSGLERVEAFGGVSFVSGALRGRGEEAEHRLDSGLVILRGGDQPAVFEDPTQGRRFEGPALTLDQRAGTITVGGSTDRARIRIARPPDGPKR